MSNLTETLEPEFKEICEEILDDKIQSVCMVVFDYTVTRGDYRPFFHWPAAIGMHHAYPGGLATHTLEVLKYARTAGNHHSYDRDILTAACLFHDLAKIREYQHKMIGMTTERYLVDPSSHLHGWFFNKPYAATIGHISGSNAEWCKLAHQFHVDQETIDKVSHCILAHHGPVREWGSPVAPQSVEAMLLHHADMLSANFGITKNQP